MPLTAKNQRMLEYIRTGNDDRSKYLSTTPPGLFVRMGVESVLSESLFKEQEQEDLHSTLSKPP